MCTCHFRRRAQPVPGDADTINHARRRLPQDFSDPTRERMWNNNTRALASTAAPGSTTADVAVYPKKSKGGPTTATGDDVIEGAGVDRGDEGGAKANAGRVGRKGARWNSPTRTTTSREKQSAGGVAGARTAEGTLVVAAAVAHMISISVVTVIDIATRREAMDVSRCLGRQQLWVHHYCTCSPASAILLYMTTGITSPSIGIAPSVSKTPQNG